MLSINVAQDKAKLLPVIAFFKQSGFFQGGKAPFSKTAQSPTWQPHCHSLSPSPCGRFTSIYRSMWDEKDMLWQRWCEMDLFLWWVGGMHIPTICQESKTRGMGQGVVRFIGLNVPQWCPTLSVRGSTAVSRRKNSLASRGDPQTIAFHRIIRICHG